MEYVYIDWLVILLAAVLNMLIGFVWYSSWLFGPLWKKLSKYKERKTDIRVFAFGFLNSLVLAYCLSLFEAHLRISSVTDGMVVGFLLWIGFIATMQMSSYIWSKTPFKLLLIDSSYRLVSLLVMSGLIGA